MDDKGYDDVAYNFFIDPFGSVLVGRGFDVEGGHTYRYNCDAYGVNFMGYFRNKNPTTIAIEAFNNLAIVSFGLQTLRHLRFHNYQFQIYLNISILIILVKFTMNRSRLIFERSEQH